MSVTSRLVLLDVVVLDHNKPVCGLEKQDFHVLEDGQSQTIQNFEPHCAEDLNAENPNAEDLDAKTGQEIPKPPSQPKDTYNNSPATPMTDSATVLLLDGLNTKAPDNQYLRRQMLEYLKNLPAGQRIAVFALGSKLRLLQGFTTSSGPLQEAIHGEKATPAASLLPSVDQAFQERQLLDALQQAHLPPLTIMNVQNFMSESDTQQTGMRVTLTLAALQELARYLGGIPGRKNLIWFSGSFPVEIYSVVETPNSFMPYTVVTGSFQDQVKATAAMLAAARVAVYPVDVRGTLMDPMYDASQLSDYAKAINGVPVGELRFAQDGKMAGLQRTEEHGTMDMLAKETGGRAVFDANALNEAVADALNDGENYYTIAYVPQNANFNGDWRKLKVSLDAKADKGRYKLFYRQGYYAMNSGSRQASGQFSVRQILAAAMEEGNPPSSQILFDAKVAASQQNPPSGPVLGQNQNLKHRAARYAIDYAISLQSVNLTETPQETHTGNLYVEAVAYDDDGKVVNGIGDTNSVELGKRQWDRLAKDKLRVHQMLDLPLGDIRLRLGVYDPASGNLGTMEIPLHVVPKALEAARSEPGSPVTAETRTSFGEFTAKPMSILEMEQMLDRLHGQPDGKLRSDLNQVQLTERVSSATLASWDAAFPGSQARDALMKIADLSAFLNPPTADVPDDPAPDRQEQINMLSMAVQYVKAAISRLPDFYATRVTTHYADTLYQTSDGTWMGQGTAGLLAADGYSRTVTYRGGAEVPFAGKGKRQADLSLGLTSSGEFGPILAQVLGDALQNRVGFRRWEKGAAGPSAVFAYRVPANASHFPVRAGIGHKLLSLFPAYHGEIAIDPNTGAILRLTEIADTDPPNQKLSAAIEVDYAPVTIEGRSYILPVRSVAFSQIPMATYSKTQPIQTYMNDVAFVDYHQFRATVRLVPDSKGQTMSTPPDNKTPAANSQH